MKEEDIRKRDAYNEYIKLVEEDSKKFFNPLFFEKTTCPACNSDDFRHQFEKNGFTHVQCNKCETLYVNPRPPFEAMDQFYTDSKSTDFWIDEFFMPVVESRRELIFKPRAEHLATRFPKEVEEAVGDIGAGFGTFLEELAKLVPSGNFFAIEPSYKMSEICASKGMTAISCSLENVIGYDNTFSLLTSFDLIGHLYDPDLFVKKVHQLLKPGGYFVLTTFNGKGFDLQILWNQSKNVFPPYHINFFNPSSITHFFVRNGFEIIEVETPGELDWDILEGMHVNEGVPIGRFWETVCAADISVKQELQKWIQKSNLSSHMRVIVQKK